MNTGNPLVKHVGSVQWKYGQTDNHVGSKERQALIRGTGSMSIRVIAS